jgi:hypothetical protein
MVTLIGQEDPKSLVFAAVLSVLYFGRSSLRIWESFVLNRCVRCRIQVAHVDWWQRRKQSAQAMSLGD